MSARLASAGFAISAFDILDDRRPTVSGQPGVHWAESAGGAADGADVLVTMLPGAQEVSDVIAEVVGRLPAGSTWIDMSTASPATARAIAAAAENKGIRSLDAPVGGGPNAARDGQLIAFVGGQRAVLDAHRDVLGALTCRIEHVGAAGAGYTVKLLVNLLWFGQALASAEALTLAHQAGIDPDALRQAVDHSAAASAFMARDASALLAGDDLTSFSLTRVCDQLATILDLGAELQVPLELGAVISDLHHQALVHYGDVDGELLGARLVAERAGVALHRAQRQPT